MKILHRVVSVSVRMIVVSGFLICARATPIVNESFETGNWAGWSTIGDTLVVGPFGTAPAHGAFQGLITNAPSILVPPDTPGSFSGNPSVGAGGFPSASPLEAFLDLPAESLSNLGAAHYQTLYGDPSYGFPWEGSAIKQSFTGNAGDILSFKWNLLSNEWATVPNHEKAIIDFAFVVLDGTLVMLADSSVASSSSSTVFFTESGYQAFSMTLTTSGIHTFGIGIVDSGIDKDVNSALLVDGFSLPLPNSLLLLGMGLSGLAAAARRRNNS